MRLITILFVLFCFPIYGDPCIDCNFIRGDFNCDEDVNGTDQYLLGNWLYSGGTAPQNADAADVNDDGSNNVADLSYLSNYLYNGGSAPPSPFSVAGFDCTRDNINKCCSQAPGNDVLSLTESSKGANDVCGLFLLPGWDVKISQWQDNSSPTAVAAFKWQNFESCDHSAVCNEGQAIWDIDDSVTFTRTELESGITQIVVDLSVGYDFNAWDQDCVECDISGAPGNEFRLEYAVPISIGPAFLGNPTKTLNTKHEVIIQSYCGTISSSRVFNFSIDCTQDLLEKIINSDECLDWKIYTISTTVSAAWFRDDGFDTSEEESLEFLLWPRVSYPSCSN